MKEKLARLLMLILDNKEDIAAITATGAEFYFTFREKFFSVSSGSSGSPGAFFAYPKYFGSMGQLATSQTDTPYAYIDGSEAKHFLGRDYVRDLYSWLDNKNMGLDELFERFGIE